MFESIELIQNANNDMDYYFWLVAYNFSFFEFYCDLDNFWYGKG